jgi:hypothetical protein
LQSNYGLPAESAAVFLALARSAGLKVRAGVLVADHIWLDATPQNSYVSAYVLLLNGIDGVEIWDAHHGRIERDSHHAGYKVLSIEDGQVQAMTLAPWTDPNQSRCVLAGTVTLDEEGGYAGELSIRTTGLFVAAESVRSSDSQKARVTSLVHHLLPDAKVEDFTLKTLASGVFEAQAKIASSEPIETKNDAYPLLLAEDGPFLADVHVPLNHSRRRHPLNHSRRRHPVQLAGAFDEWVQLTIEWPEDWSPQIRPRGLAASGKLWNVEQKVSDGEHSLTLTRHTRVNDRIVPAEDFLPLREALNGVRAEPARTLLLKP